MAFHIVRGLASADGKWWLCAVLSEAVGPVPGDDRVLSGKAVFDITVPDQAWLVEMFRNEALPLVRLARFFVDDRDAAEDLVQEAFIRLSRSGQRVSDPDRIGSYLRSIVLNLARDHNRRGMMSLRHQLPAGREIDVDLGSVEREVLLHEGHRDIIRAVRALPRRQRACVVLRYYEDLGIAEIADVLGVSPNSVKTHLRRALASLELVLADGLS